MSQRRSYKITCPKCGQIQEVELYESVDVSSSPELKGELMSDQLNSVRCEGCEFTFRVDKVLLYSDPDRAVLIYWIPIGEGSSEEGEERFREAVAAINGMLPEGVPFADAVHNIGRTALLTAALTSGDVERLRGMMADRLHQPYRASITPGAAEAMAAAREAGALDAAVSGAGPTVLALATEGEAEIKDAMQTAYTECDIEARCFSVSPDLDGAQVTRREEVHE